MATMTPKKRSDYPRQLPSNVRSGIPHHPEQVDFVPAEKGRDRRSSGLATGVQTPRYPRKNLIWGDCYLLVEC